MTPVDNLFEISGSPKHFLILVLIVFGSCTTCYVADRWTIVERHRAESAMIHAECDRCCK